MGRRQSWRARGGAGLVAAAAAVLLGPGPAAGAAEPITFVRQHDGPTLGGSWSRVYTVRPDGSHLREVTHEKPPPKVFWVAWRPDHELILFAGQNPATVRPDGSHRRTLTTGRYVNREDPAYRPDGRRIASAAFNGKPTHPRYAIAVTRADGSDQRNVTAFDLNARAPTWSPSGKAIAFVAKGEVWRMRANGASKAILTAEAAPAEAPDWSPDGKRIVYSAGGSLFTIRRDGGGRRLLVDGTEVEPGLAGAANDPAWTPGGGRIVFDWGGRLYTVRSSGKDVERLTSPKTGTSDYRPDW